MQFWTSLCKKNTKVLESFQRRVTEPVKAWQSTSYEERQRTPGIPSLKKKRLIGDLTALCSSLRKGNAEDVSFFSLEPMTYRIGTKLCKRRFTLDVRKNVFTMQVV